MKNPRLIIKAPVVSEKSTLLSSEKGKYTFSVARNANKIEIKRAVQEIYGVTVLNVNAMTVKGKKRRVRYQMGKRSDWKKAVVTLKEGDRIEFT